ncbi:MAG: DNA polymerase III subunit delta [Gammaproteobacteria bacterium]
MKEAAENFIDSLRKKPPGGAYIFYGEEPQLIDEARDSLRAAGNFGKNVERASLELFSDSSSADSKIAESPGGSLFGGGAFLYEIIAHSPPSGIRAAEKGDGKGAFRVLQNIVARVSPPDTLAVSFYGLERKHHKAKWLADLCQNAAAAVNCARLDAAQTAVWCRKWAKMWGFSLAENAAEWLAAQTEGNLSAAKQCLQKMQIAGMRADTPGQIAEALSGGAHYNIFQLTEAALAGNGKKSIAILNVLLYIEEPPPLLVWAAGNAAAGILAAKRGDYPAGMSRPSAQAAREIAAKTPEEKIIAVMRRAARADRIAKGVEKGDFKIAITDAVAGLACLRRGITIPTPRLHPQE